MKAREEISLAELSRPRPHIRGENIERRNNSKDRPADDAKRPSLEEQAQASVRHGRAIDFVAVCIVVATFAYLIAEQAGNALAAPLLTISETLKTASAR